MNFKVGEKVVCIDDSNPRRADLLIKIKRNEIYTIREIYISQINGGEIFNLEEVIGEICPFWGREIGYYSVRFRKLDYDFAENLLAEIKEQVQFEHQLN